MGDGPFFFSKKRRLKNLADPFGFLKDAGDT
jgi:hypothetical protein